MDCIRLRAVDQTYPITPAIQRMLPKEAPLLQGILSDPCAAHAIMELGDAELARQSMANSRTFAKELCLKIYLSGSAKLACNLSGTEAESWLKLRKVSIKKGTSDSTLVQKIIQRLLVPNNERIQNAESRLKNIVLQHKAQ